MGNPTWTNWERMRGIPTSWVIRSARDSLRASSAWPTLVNRAVRSATGTALHPGKARRAAATARSMSAAVPSGTVPATSSVVGSTTSMVEDPEGSDQTPPI